jgi:alcohol dehydrogenase class IV
VKNSAVEAGGRSTLNSDTPPAAGLTVNTPPAAGLTVNAPPEPAWGLQAAAAMGLEPTSRGQGAQAAAEAAASHVSNLVGQLHLPRRLRDAGVKEADLAHLAQLAYQSRTVQNNPKPISGPAPLEALLRAAW